MKYKSLVCEKCNNGFVWSEEEPHVVLTASHRLLIQPFYEPKTLRGKQDL